MSEQWQNNLYPWQKILSGAWFHLPCLCGHPVGAGKTTTEIAGAMTLRRMGFDEQGCCHRANHLLEQITAEAQRLYPGANILMVSRDESEPRPAQTLCCQDCRPAIMTLL